MYEVWFHPLRFYDWIVYEFLVPPKQDTSPLHFINLITSEDEGKFKPPNHNSYCSPALADA
jgi:hypothetical protein